MSPSFLPRKHLKTARPTPPESTARGPHGDADRRAHRRHTADEVASLDKVRLKFGPAVTLVDLSQGGAQIETGNFRLQPGSVVVFEIAGGDTDLAVPSRVLRCQLARILPEPVYRGALEFKSLLDLKGLLPRSSPDVRTEAGLDPVLEQARLQQIVKRVQLTGVADREAAAVRARLLDALASALAVVGSPAGRRAGPALGAELGTLFKTMSAAIEGRQSSKGLMSATEQQLLLLVQARSIALTDADDLARTSTSEAIVLSMPRLADEAPTGKVAVEFAEGFEPHELHFQLLKAGVPLMALARELGRLNGDDARLDLATE
jgi:PilZ domain